MYRGFPIRYSLDITPRRAEKNLRRIFRKITQEDMELIYQRLILWDRIYIMGTTSARRRRRLAPVPCVVRVVAMTFMG